MPKPTVGESLALSLLAVAGTIMFLIFYPTASWEDEIDIKYYLRQEAIQRVELDSLGVILGDISVLDPQTDGASTRPGNPPAENNWTTPDDKPIPPPPSAGGYFPLLDPRLKTWTYGGWSYYSYVLKDGSTKWHTGWDMFGYSTTSGATRPDPVFGVGGNSEGGPNHPTINAYKAGIVVKVYKSDAGYGHGVRIAHPDGRTSIYGHMTKGTMNLKTGDVVNAGQAIGIMGSTGNSTAVHLHFELGTNSYKGKWSSENWEAIKASCSPEDQQTINPNKELKSFMAPFKVKQSTASANASYLNSVKDLPPDEVPTTLHETYGITG